MLDVLLLEVGLVVRLDGGAVHAASVGVMTAAKEHKIYYYRETFIQDGIKSLSEPFSKAFTLSLIMSFN